MGGDDFEALAVLERRALEPRCRTARQCLTRAPPEESRPRGPARTLDEELAGNVDVATNDQIPSFRASARVPPLSST